MLSARTPGNMPLLILSHAEDGIVAQLNSDSAWLWGRGWDGGGPQAELLRRVAHWLMKEPELEENKLSGDVVAGQLQVDWRGLTAGDHDVTVTRPDGTQSNLRLTDHGDGRASAKLPADQNGLWRIADDKLTALIAVGSLNLLEMGDVRASATKLQPIVTANGGVIDWLEDGIPSLVKQPVGSQMAGSGWLGLRANGQQSISATSSRSLLPGWLFLLLAIVGLALAWWQDSRR